MLHSSSSGPVERLSENQCWNALASMDLGRLAIRAGDDIEIFPVNYLVNSRLVYLRTSPGTKIEALTIAPRVAFEVDAIRDAVRWSVVVKGTAERLKFDDEIEESGILELRSVDPSPKWNYVRITPHNISGRRYALTSWPAVDPN
jgi:nitroimidazol reductase NimA-like FMN-containing flavoprotein (pyridoxamine 5'-phosphate oxidase superfamily)